LFSKKVLQGGEIMSQNWGPFFIVPSENLKKLSGHVQLRERLDEDILTQELEGMGLVGPVIGITNPWYCRRKGDDTWIKIGESAAKQDNFPVSWDTTRIPNGEYEVLGLPLERETRNRLSPGTVSSM